MNTAEEVAEKVLKAADTQTYFGRNITEWMVAAIEEYREQIIDDMAERSHPDDWGVPCVYVESYAEKLREQS